MIEHETIPMACSDERLPYYAERYGTPLYVYDGEKVEQQYQRLKETLPSPFEVFYSAKCNPLLGICQLLRGLGSSIEVASGGELHTAVEAGFQPQQIIWTSPGKTEEELLYAIEKGIYSINVESVTEARTLSRLAVQQGVTVQMSVRINPDFHPAGAGLKMTGVPTPFGIDQASAVDALKTIASLPGLALIGLHVFTGSQVLDATILAETMEQIFQLALSLSEEAGLPLAFLDLGGGFGVPYFPGEPSLDTALLREELAAVWARHASRLEGVRIGVESGRFLLAESGAYVARVIDVKACKGTTFAVCDGGSHQHAASAFLGRYVRNNFPMRVIPAASDRLTDRPEPADVTMVGPLCTPTDVIGQKVLLTPPEPGDLLVVERSGAYGLTHSPVMFLSHPLPAEVLSYQGEDHLLRERGKADDFLRGQHALDLSERVRAIHA
ncbi:type III PLP-dependent enzyme [Gorillibacterium sp. CAU 1737]|uniref:type III PLP-dependent enzyme n=1 Tax=Gorillibacterium sp. CAU 1737 TaxID=3140362 RepID=UPI003260DADA